MEFEVIGLEFELFDEILFEIEEETIAGWGEAYEQSRVLGGGPAKSGDYELLFARRNYCHLRRKRWVPDRGNQVVETCPGDGNAG